MSFPHRFCTMFGHNGSPMHMRCWTPRWRRSMDETWGFQMPTSSPPHSRHHGLTCSSIYTHGFCSTLGDGIVGTAPLRHGGSDARAHEERR